MTIKINNINPLLNNLGEDVMGFLNEIQLKYSNAISLASGRPDENYFNIQDFSSYIDIYVDQMCQKEKKSKKEILNKLGQYSFTKGIVNELVSIYLKKDEKIEARSEDILITVGTQESLAIAVITLCDRENDVILIEDPTYIGITHFSLITGYDLVPVPVNSTGISLDILEEKIIQLKERGKNVKMVYVISDYQNPTGSAMPLENRIRLLQLASTYDFFILEDNAYSEFSYEGFNCLSLKALDTKRKVVYLRSLSKTLYPSLRLGIMVADQVISLNGMEVALSDLLAKTKGYLTVNTPSLNQAVLGGMLIKNNYSFQQFNKKKTFSLKKKRDKVLLLLDMYLDKKKFPWLNEVNWNIPKGGFFMTIRVPFEVNKAEVILCAQKYYVIFTPMTFFYLHEGGNNEIRIAFSNLTIDIISTAIERLSAYIKYKIHTKKNEHNGILKADAK